MFVGMLFTVIVSLVIGFFSLLAAFNSYYANPKRATQAVTGFGLFWAGMAGTWFATASLDLFWYLGYPSFAITSTYVLQTFVGVSLVAAAYFFSVYLLSRRARIPALVIYGFWYIAFLSSLFWYRVVPQPDSFFVGQILTANETIMLFMGAFLPLWTSAFILFAQSIRKGRRVHDGSHVFPLFASLAFILVGLGGSVDEIGIVYGWMVTAARLVTLIASIVAFTASSTLREPDEMVI